MAGSGRIEPTRGHRPRVLAVAGEVSGDHQGGGLIAELLRSRPDATVLGVGGPAMAAAGADVLVDSTRWGVIGYVEAYSRLPVFGARFWRIARLIRRLRPDLLLLVDFPGMNRELVRAFSGRLPIVYFVPPQTYGRRGRSAARMASAAVRLLAVLPFEADAYRQAGADVAYVGHPAVDEAGRGPTRTALRREWDADESSLVGLLPGSRVQEVRDLLPPMVEAVRTLAPGRRLRCVLPLASGHLRPYVAPVLERAGVPVRIVDGRALDIMVAADALVVASGTAAVQAACAGTPMVVVYRVSPITEWIARTFVITPGAGAAGWSIPNIILGRPVVPELVQREVTGPRIRDELVRLLGADGAALRGQLGEVRRRLGPPGVLARAAGEVLRVLDRRGGTAIR